MPGEQGIQRNVYEALRRVHVATPDWANVMGTDYWLTPGKDYLSASKSTTLADRGWTTTTQVITLGSATTDNLFAHVASAIPNAFAPTAASSSLVSPAIFGDYDHAWSAARIMQRNSLPRYLVCDMYGAFLTSSAAEIMTGFGFLEGNGSNGTTGDLTAQVYSDGTNFQLYTGAATAITKAVDALWHHFRIVFDNSPASGGPLVRFQIDGATPTGFTAPAVPTGDFPVSFAMWTGTTNRPNLSRAHIFYAWNLPTNSLMGQAVV